jgi:sugar phosphate isomerase/epimerase
MKLGIGSYTFTWAIGVPGYPPEKPMDAFELLEIAFKIGAPVVQLCDNLPLLALNPVELERFIHTAREWDISVELGVRGIHPWLLRRNLKLAQKLGCAFLRVVVDSDGDHPSSDDIISRLKPLMREFDDANISIAIENHDRFAARDLVEIIEALGPKHAGICLDTVNSFGALEGPEQVVSVLAPYCLNLHVKDFTIQRMKHQMGFTIEGCPAGSGRLNIPWLFEAIRKAGKNPNAILELWTPFFHSLEETIALERSWTEKSVAYLRKNIID